MTVRNSIYSIRNKNDPRSISIIISIIISTLFNSQKLSTKKNHLINIIKHPYITKRIIFHISLEKMDRDKNRSNSFSNEIGKQYLRRKEHPF